MFTLKEWQLKCLTIPTDIIDVTEPVLYISNYAILCRQQTSILPNREGRGQYLHESLKSHFLYDTFFFVKQSFLYCFSFEKRSTPTKWKYVLTPSLEPSISPPKLYSLIWSPTTTSMMTTWPAMLAPSFPLETVATALPFLCSWSCSALSLMGRACRLKR